MSRTTRSRITLVAATVLLIVAACTTPPEPQPPEPAPAVPEPQPTPDPEPQPRAPLEGPVWILESLYGTTRVPVPPPGSVAVTFDSETGFQAFTALGTFGGTYRLPGNNLLSLDRLASDTREGRFARFQSLLEENLSLVKGYYITGDVREESRLTLYGGVGREEIILAEFYIEPRE